MELPNEVIAYLELGGGHLAGKMTARHLVPGDRSEVIFSNLTDPDPGVNEAFYNFVSAQEPCMLVVIASDVDGTRNFTTFIRVGEP